MRASTALTRVPDDAGETGSRKLPLVVRYSVFLAAFMCGSLGAAHAQNLQTVQPFGENPIGYMAFTLQGAADELTPRPDDRRRLLVEVWFPAQDAGSQRKAWASDAMGAALARSFPFPDGFHSSISTHTWIDATPLATALPAIVFSHGLSFPSTLYQSFFEDLASRGYALFAVSHPHGTPLVEYPDGTATDMSLWPRIQDEAERQRMLARAGDQWSADLSVVIDAIREGVLPGGLSVDRSRIGLMGHSLGGTAAAKLSRDERISAVAIMEGEVRESTDEMARGTIQVAVPLLHLIGGYNRLELERLSYLPGANAPVFTAVINGTGHAYFSDLIHFYREYANRDWRERHRYEVDPDRVIRISSDYIAAFFDWRMKSAPTNVLLRPRSYTDRVAGPQQSGYPEVDLTVAVQ